MKRSPPDILELPAAQGADHWQKILQPSSLTLLPGSFERIQQALQRPNSNADQVALALAPDPAACLHFYVQANRLLQASGNEIHSLSHLVSLLGFPQVRAQLHKLPVADESMPGYWRQLQVSLLSVQLLQRLPLDAAGVAFGDLYFAALFCNLPTWLRWQCAADEQAWLEGLARNPKIGPTKAAQLVYGAELDHWQCAQLARMSLPQLLKEVLATPADKIRRQLRQLARAHHRHLTPEVENRRALIVVTAHLLAQRLCLAPTHSSARLCQQLLATLLHASEARVAQAAHCAVGQLPILHPLIIDDHPGRRLLCHWPRYAELATYSLPRPQVQQSAPANHASAPTRLLDNRFKDPDTVRHNLAALSQGGPRLQSLNGIFHCVRDTLSLGFGMEFGGLLVRTQTEQWQLKQAFAHPEDADLPSHTEAANLLTKLAAKPAAVLVNRDNRAALQAHLPAALTEPLAGRDALFISLFLGGKLITILLAAEADLSPPRVQACKRLARAAQQAIARLAVKVKRRSINQH